MLRTVTISWTMTATRARAKFSRSFRETMPYKPFKIYASLGIWSARSASLKDRVPVSLRRRILTYRRAFRARCLHAHVCRRDSLKAHRQVIVPSSIFFGSDRKSLQHHGATSHAASDIASGSGTSSPKPAIPNSPISSPPAQPRSIPITNAPTIALKTAPTDRNSLMPLSPLGPSPFNHEADGQSRSLSDLSDI